MITATLIVLGSLLGATSGQLTSSQCQDLNTQSCIGFHQSRQDLCDDPVFADSVCKRHCGNCPLECYACPTPVLHPQDCNKTVACGPGEQCVTRHLRAKDGHHEYLMACEAKEICSLVIGAFGKRDINDLEGFGEDERGRYERDVVMNCCDSDLCNFEIQTTIASATSPVTTASVTSPGMTSSVTPASVSSTTQSITHGPCEKDVVFVMQNHVTRSAHVRYGQPAQWIPFVEKVVAQINAGQNKTNVAVMTFDTGIRVHWYLNKYSTAAEVQHALAQLQHTKIRVANFGSINQHVLTQLNTDVLTSGHGDRPQYNNVVVVLELSSAFTREGSNFPAEVNKLHALSDNVILVSVGADPDPSHYGIATDSAHMFHVSTNSRLLNALPNIVSLICS